MHFLDLSTSKRLCLGVIEGLLIILLVKTNLTRTRLGVVFTIFGSSDSSKILLHVSRGILYVRFFSIDLYIALTLILNRGHHSLVIEDSLIHDDPVNELNKKETGQNANGKSNQKKLNKSKDLNNQNLKMLLTDLYN